MSPHSTQPNLILDDDSASFSSSNSDDNDQINHKALTSINCGTHKKFHRSRTCSFSSSSSTSSVSCQRLSPLLISSSCDIRSRLFNKLGISSKDSRHNLTPPRRLREPTSVVLQGQSNAFKEALKADYGKPDKTLNNTAAITSPPVTPNKSRAVSFDAEVQVHPIPARAAYSKRMRCVLWTHPVEMQQNAARNSLEFAAEGWDWKQVADDEDMVIYAGERIHPIHFVQETNLNRHFCNVMATQQQDQS